MRPELLEITTCPGCSAPDLTVINVSAEDRFGISEGTVRCSTCAREYPVARGVLNLLPDPSSPPEYVPGTRGRTATTRASAPTPWTAEQVANRDNLEADWVWSTKVNFDRVFSALEFEAGERLLELGSGTCWATARFASAGLDCIALDSLSENKLDAGAYWIDRDQVFFERLLGDFHEPPFLAESFHLVFACASLMYCRDLGNSLERISRLLRPGGRLVLIEPSSPPYRRGSRRTTGSGHFLGFFEWMGALRRNGFRIRKVFFPESARLKLLEHAPVQNQHKWYFALVRLVSPVARALPTRWWSSRWMVFAWLLLSPANTPLLLIAERREPKSVEG